MIACYHIANSVLHDMKTKIFETACRLMSHFIIRRRRLRLSLASKATNRNQPGTGGQQHKCGCSHWVATSTQGTLISKATCHDSTTHWNLMPTIYLIGFCIKIYESKSLSASRCSHRCCVLKIGGAKQCLKIWVSKVHHSKNHWFTSWIHPA